MFFSFPKIDILDQLDSVRMLVVTLLFAVIVGVSYTG